jgi:hypothetical protein
MSDLTGCFLVQDNLLICPGPISSSFKFHSTILREPAAWLRSHLSDDWLCGDRCAIVIMLNLSKEKMMKKAILLAAIILIGSAPHVLSQQDKGASGMSPGDKMKDSTTSTKKGASEFSPGDKMKDSTAPTKKGASEFSPGDKMNDKK